MTSTIVTQNTQVDYRRRTEEATWARACELSEKRNKRMDEAIAKTARETPEAAGDILWMV